MSLVVGLIIIPAGLNLGVHPRPRDRSGVSLVPGDPFISRGLRGLRCAPSGRGTRCNPQLLIYLYCTKSNAPIGRPSVVKCPRRLLCVLYYQSQSYKGHYKVMYLSIVIHHARMGMGTHTHCSEGSSGSGTTTRGITTLLILLLLLPLILLIPFKFLP